MSSEAQLQGDSLRRQLQRAQEYASRNGLELDERSIQDLGVSGFDGKNVSRGQLGHFLQAVREGRIEPGSTLIVESLDRLSREQLLTVLPRFLDILNAKITIVTLTDGMIYRPGLNEPTTLMMGIIAMHTANAESTLKADRISRAWAQKRRNIGQKPYTKRCKEWLVPRAMGVGFDEKPRARATLHQMFTAALDLGCEVIVRRFNKSGPRSFGRTGLWNHSYVRRILRDPAVIGRFQPHRLVRGRRVPDGEPIEGFYPIMIDESLFFQVQNRLNERRVTGGGRKGTNFTNLFPKLLRCGNCFGKMHVRNKGKHRDKWLICDNAMKGTKCLRLYWRYSEFETSVLSFLREIDLRALVQNVTEARQTLDHRDRLQEMAGRLAEVARRRDRAFQLLTGQEATDHLETEYRKLDREAADLKAEVDRLTAEEQSMTAETMAFAEGQRAAPELIAQFQATDEQGYRIRSALAARLGDLIKNILLYPGGIPLEDHEPFDKTKRCYSIGFKDGSRRVVQTSLENPNEFIVSFVAPGSRLTKERRTLDS
jgi:DNA invertase Pin-like site-specific DNA recombinase